MMPRRLLPALLVCCLAAKAASSHEFWIEPTEYQVESGTALTANLRNGQKFSGVALAYFEKRTARFDLIRGQEVTGLAGRMGDVPALQSEATGDGLAVIVHQTMPSTLTYKDWDKFAAFAAHKDFADIATRQDARDLPRSGFTESYTRFAKALVGVGASKGSDVVTGMETEFVALSNPYTDDLRSGLAVRLLYQGTPRAAAQVEVFEKAPDGTVKIELLRTNAAGEVTIPVRSGSEYLLDAVVLRPAPDADPAVWETLWAALTLPACLHPCAIHATRRPWNLPRAPTSSPGLFMTALIWALMRWLFGVFHGLGMGHRLRGLWRLQLICRVMVSGFIGRSSRGLRRLRVAGLSSRQSVQDGDEQGFVWTG